MALKAFTLAHVYEKQAASKEKDKSSIQCLESYDRNLYIGSKDATVQHLILHSSTNGAVKTSEGKTRKLGSSGPVTQLRAVPVFNHLLVLWDRGVTALNMFSLEPIAALKKIQHVSLFEVCKSSRGACVEMATSSSRRKIIRIHTVGVDRWEVVKEVPMPQEPVALAADGAGLCVATANRYLVCDVRTGSSLELFPHNLSRQRVIVASVGGGEFLLNGPGSFGMFVMKTGICQRPPLHWPGEVLAARACFPYVLTLQATSLSVYSMLDQQCKQTVSLSGGKGLISTPDGVLVFTERDVFSLTLAPLEDQIRALVGYERVEEALLLLDGVQSRFPLDSYKELQKAIARLAGFVYFYQEVFSEAKNLLIKGELDPREIISLYPDMEPCLGEGFQPQLDQVGEARDLRALRREDGSAFRRYLDFLGDFLRAFRGKEQSVQRRKEVDCALLRLYAELGDDDKLQQLVALPNACRLDYCAPVLQQHNRFFALGSLHLSHGKQIEAIKTWVEIADGHLHDLSCSDVYGHIVWTLSQMNDKDAVWTFADWTLQRNQEIGVQIFTKRAPGDRAMFVTRDVLALLAKYPLASLLYLEFLIHDLQSEEELHHNLLVLAYVTQVLQEENGADPDNKTRGKLQQLLWDSIFYDIFTVYERVQPTALHVEKAIILGRAGEHARALQVLVHEERDPRAAEAYCCRVTQDQDTQLRQTLLLSLLNIYLNSENLTSAAVDLLKNHPQVFATEKVIQLLPDSWSLQLVSQFLLGSLRESLHQRRMGRVQRALVQAELLRHKVIWMQASQTMIKMDKSRVCAVCQRDLTEPQFARNLRGELTHTTCAGEATP